VRFLAGLRLRFFATTLRTLLATRQVFTQLLRKMAKIRLTEVATTCKVLQVAMYNIDILISAKFEKGWTTLKVARVAGLPETTVRTIFKKKAGHPDNVRAIAKALGFTLKELLPSRNGKH
jgi:lambda repressor-like predicted transcriptional regulator